MTRYSARAGRGTLRDALVKPRLSCTKGCAASRSNGQPASLFQLRIRLAEIAAQSRAA